MKKAGIILLLFCFVLSIGIAEAQKREKITTEKFTGISLRTSGNVYIRYGKETSVEIEANENTRENIDIYVNKGNLVIELRRGITWSWRNQDRLDVYVTMSELNYLAISSSGNIRTENKFKTDKLDLKISGSGTIEAAADAKIINADISGSGNIRMKGSADELYPKISGSGKIDGEDLVTKTVSIKISGSGNCTVNVSESLDASVSGSGNIYYTGNPNNVNTHMAGSGRVKKLN